MWINKYKLNCFTVDLDFTHQLVLNPGTTPPYYINGVSTFNLLLVAVQIFFLSPITHIGCLHKQSSGFGV